MTVRSALLSLVVLHSTYWCSREEGPGLWNRKRSLHLWIWLWNRVRVRLGYASKDSSRCLCNLLPRLTYQGICSTYWGPCITPLRLPIRPNVRGSSVLIHSVWRRLAYVRSKVRSTDTPYQPRLRYSYEHIVLQLLLQFTPCKFPSRSRPRADFWQVNWGELRTIFFLSTG